MGSRERLVLIEGDPGSGKTVLLREVAYRLCSRAGSSWKANTPVGLYFNLKKLDRSAGQVIDSDLIRQYVTDQIKKFGAPEISRYFEQNFDQGIREGWWFFLFDSFDEIPDVLNSEDVSENIDRYSEAILSFATDFSRCRTLLATRYFRRPKDSSQSKLRLLPLSNKQRNELIGRASLAPQAVDRLYSGIATAGAGLRQICENPMYFTLLIEYVRGGAEVPRNAHELFGSFVEKRLENEEQRLREFEADPASIRRFAEAAAFQIVADSTLGLNPTREALLNAVAKIRSEWQHADKFVTVLEDIGFCRGESDAGDGHDHRFTFSHRRLQEYFATCYVIRVQESVTEDKLLFDGRWRETAIVLLSSGAGKRVELMLALAEQFLSKAVVTIRENGQYSTQRLIEAAISDVTPNFFVWPSSTLHILSILQDAFGTNPTLLPADIRGCIADIVRSAFFIGRLQDRRVALEVAGALTDVELVPVLRFAISLRSGVLDDVAFRQMQTLALVPDDVSSWLRIELLRRAGLGELDSRTLLLFLSRVPDNGRLFSAATLLSNISPIDNILHLMIAIGLIVLARISILDRALFSIAILALPFFRRLLWFCSARAMKKVRFATVLQLNRRPRMLKWILPSLPSAEALLRAQIWLFVFYLILVRGLVVLDGTLIELDFSLGAWLLSFGLLYLTAWAPMAIVAVSSGKFTSKRWWSALTLYPLLRVVSEPLASFRGIGTHLKRYGLGYVLYGVMLGSMFWLSTAGSDGRTRYGFVIFLVLTWVPMAILFLENGRRWLVDVYRFRQFQNGVSEIAPADFLDALGKFHFNSFRIRFIRLVLSNLCLPVSDQSLDIIRNLSLAVDRDLFRGDSEPSMATGNSIVDQWKTTYISRTKFRQKTGLRGWGNDVLDELLALERRLVEGRRFADLSRN